MAYKQKVLPYKQLRKLFHEKAKAEGIDLEKEINAYREVLNLVKRNKDKWPDDPTQYALFDKKGDFYTPDPRPKKRGRKPKEDKAKDTKKKVIKKKRPYKKRKKRKYNKRKEQVKTGASKETSEPEIVGSFEDSLNKLFVSYSALEAENKELRAQVGPLLAEKTESLEKTVKLEDQLKEAQTELQETKTLLKWKIKELKDSVDALSEIINDEDEKEKKPPRKKRKYVKRKKLVKKEKSSKKKRKYIKKKKLDGKSKRNPGLEGPVWSDGACATFVGMSTEYKEAHCETKGFIKVDGSYFVNLERFSVFLTRNKITGCTVEKYLDVRANISNGGIRECYPEEPNKVYNKEVLK